MTQDMYLRKVIYRMLIITMYVSGGLIPTYLVMRAFGLRNSFLIYVVPTALSAFNVVLIKTFIESLPKALEESAQIEGAGVLRCWLYIIMPASKPILATIAVFAMVGQWNAWFDNMIYMSHNDLDTLQFILYKYLQETQNMTNRLKQLMESGVGEAEASTTPATVRMTVTAVITLPILFVYPFMQRYFVKGIMIGAIKG